MKILTAGWIVVPGERSRKYAVAAGREITQELRAASGIPNHRFPARGGCKYIGFAKATGGGLCWALDNSVSRIGGAACAGDDVCRAICAIDPYGHGRAGAGGRYAPDRQTFPRGRISLTLATGITPDGRS